MFVCGRRVGREGGENREEKEKDTREKEEGREESRPRKRTAVLSNKQVVACPRVHRGKKITNAIMSSRASLELSEQR